MAWTQRHDPDYKTDAMVNGEETPDRRTMVDGLVATWVRVVTDPHGFFDEMPETGGLAEPALFLAICAAINAVGHVFRGFGLLGIVGDFVLQIILAAVLATLLVLIAQHLFEGKAGFEPTFRVVAYAWAPLVLAWIPVLAGIPLLYSAYIIVRGVERVQRIDTLRAVLTTIIGLAGVAAIAYLA